MVIDDGSRDNTEELINTWSAENKIRIQYCKKQNGGKASALNVGINLLKTPYAVCLDSDDTFYPNTIEKAIQSLALCCISIWLCRNGIDSHLESEY